MGDATKLDVDAWERDFRINVTSMMLMSRHAIPEMRKSGRGAIVNMSSVSGCKSGAKPLDASDYELTRVRSCSTWRQSVSALSNKQRCHHPDDPSDGGTARAGKHSCQLRMSRHGVHADGSRPRHDGRDAPSTDQSEPAQAGGDRVGRWLR